MSGPCLPACLAAALDYLRRGWSVIPLCPPGHEEVSGAHEKSCTRPGKEPMWDWQAYRQRRARPQELNVLWSRNRHQNVGLVLGPVSGLIGVDVEGSAGEQFLRDLSAGDLAPTLEMLTPALSRRLFYRWPEAGLPTPPADALALYRPVRLLGEGCYSVVPPSRHQFGAAYTWASGRGPGEVEPAPCPWWVLDFYAGQNLARPVEKTDGQECPSYKKTDGQRIPSQKPARQRRLVDLERRPLVWLWQHWIPLGKLTLLDGDPGLGKSTVLLDLAARVSRNGLMPDGSQGVRGHVVLLSAEDGVEDTIRPRLEAAGADLEHLHVLPPICEDGVERCLEIPRDLSHLEHSLEEVDARLLLIDPLAAFVCGRDANKDQAIRRVLYQLSRIAERRRCAVICMRHLNKTAGRRALYRGNMSIGVIGHARAGLLIAPDPDDAGARILAVSKCNLAAPPASLRFRLIAAEAGEVCRVDWLGPSGYDADQILQPPALAEEREIRAEAISKVALAMTILKELLAGGAQEIRRLKKECASAGLSPRTVERAAHRLNLALDHQLVEGRNFYTWELPAEPAQEMKNEERTTENEQPK